MSARDKVIEAIKEFRFWNYGMDEVDPNSEYAEWVPALADAICAAIDDQPFHVIEFGDGWTLKHPLDCRDTLFECPVNRAAEALDGPLKPPGRYRCELDERGGLAVWERVDR
jgi:hypothetical protein